MWIWNIVSFLVGIGIGVLLPIKIYRKESIESLISTLIIAGSQIDKNKWANQTKSALMRQVNKSYKKANAEQKTEIDNLTKAFALNVYEYFAGVHDTIKLTDKVDAKLGGISKTSTDSN